MDRLTEVLRRAGLRAVRHESIGTFDPESSERFCYRVELDDGRTIKVRRLRNEARAQHGYETRLRVDDDAFARAFARDGHVLLEEWIDGEPATLDHLEEAAQLLARLHALESGGVTTTKWRETTEASLDELGFGHLQATLGELDPGQTRQGIVHTDYCGENMVIDADGRLRVIDNEGISIDALDYDLARAWYRWPMPEDAWDRFLAAYGAHGPLEFWKLVAVVKSATLRTNRGLDASTPFDLLGRWPA